VTEEVILRLGRDLHRQTGLKYLVLAVASPSTRRHAVAARRSVRDIWIQPAAGDAEGHWEQPSSPGISC